MRMRPTVATIVAMVISWVVAAAAQANEICAALPNWPEC